AHPPTTYIYTLSLHDALPIFLPSKGNGLVTTATVKIPNSRAISATTGAAPVPVPPPIPAAINIISAPWIVFLMFSRSSSAERRRSEEHTSELQSRENLVCRLL